MEQSSETEVMQANCMSSNNKAGLQYAVLRIHDRHLVDNIKVKRIAKKLRKALFLQGVGYDGLLKISFPNLTKRLQASTG